MMVVLSVCLPTRGQLLTSGPGGLSGAGEGGGGPTSWPGRDQVTPATGLPVPGDTGSPPGVNPDVLVDLGDNWRYLKGLPGTPPGNWNQPAFADSGWLLGATGIGYGDNDDTTVLSDMPGNYLTVYARRVFSVPDPGALTSLTLQIDYDDGFVAYLNGVEIARRNLGAPGTPVNANTPADATHEAGTPESITFSTAGLGLAGTNALAIEIHNDDLYSSDLSLAPRLLTSSVPAGPGLHADSRLVWTQPNTPITITLTGSGPAGEDLTFLPVAGPSHGTLSDLDNSPLTSATVTYTPAMDYAGVDSFFFVVSSGNQVSTPADVSIMVSDANSGGDWAPPIGVPMPTFGITQTAPPPPDPWLVPVPGFYCVDQFNRAATDTNNPYGTPSLPRRTIPSTLPAGAVVEVLNRYSYAPTGYQQIQVNGTPDSPVYIRGLNARSRPDWTRDLYISGSYAIIENIHFTDHDGTLAGGLYLLAPSNHLAVRACELSGNLVSQSGLRVESWNTSLNQHHVIFNNVVHNNGDVNSPTDQDVHGVHVGARAQYIWIVDNVMYANSGDGVQINAGTAAQAQTHHIFVGRNTAHGNKQSGFWTKQAVDVIFSQNTSYHHRPGNSSYGTAMGEQYGPERAWFLFNHVYDCEYGIAQSSASGLGFGQNIYIIGNVIHNIHHTTPFNPNTGWSQSAIMLAEGPGAYIVNNTIYDVDGGINSPGLAAYHLENNVIANVTEPQGHHVFVEQGGASAQSTLENSLLYGVGGPILITWPGGNNYTNLPAFVSGTGQGQNCLNAAPLFVDAPGGDFHLQSGSPGVNAGMNSSVYGLFQTLYGLSINFDYAGTPRPQGGAYDMGAFEQ
jgi:uncharacterized protein (DUF3820 family)